ncbi:helix-turn-helix domain-containing protein [Indiicoccus explosivorum]|uniref:helix-turn-helix domain-containing protein n=1 Tax=Indiicoccus explosivorum TaxID=1917864 RepID=UPI000B443CAE|nr:helix-turn-helix domain-containing protein [Indiicoccus explosivorum]
MSFNELILSIMDRLDGQRTVSAPFHVLKGKKSGQTIQDIGYFGLHPFFGVISDLQKGTYDEAVTQLCEAGLIEQADGPIKLTEKGRNRKKVPVRLDGWTFQGRERLFFARLSLAVQTFSHVRAGNPVFDPAQTRTDIQFWVKDYLRKMNFSAPESYAAFRSQLTESLMLADCPDRSKTILVDRLSGIGIGGLTWRQISAEYGISEMDAKIEATAALHAWLAVLREEGFPMLIPFLEGVLRHSPLTDSTKRTLRLYKEGLSVDEIAAVRKLKRSTIEDHFVELAMNDPAFDFTSFMSREAYERVNDISKSSGSKKLRDIKEQLPELSYFQIRLALSAGGEQP